MLWVDTIFLITFSMYMVRISHWKSMFKTGGKQQCHSNPFCLEIDDTMYFPLCTIKHWYLTCQ